MTKMQDKQNYVCSLNDPFHSFERLLNRFDGPEGGQFVLSFAGTKASEHEGISAAGSSPEARRLTPALDAETLLLGKPVTAASLPVSPSGIVSPVVITRACLSLMNLSPLLVDCGSFHPALTEAMKLSTQVADCPSTGKALPLPLVKELYQSGIALGQSLSESRSYLILAECVPGGTTTAMALLTALGYETKGLLSSSLPNSNHEQRFQLVEKGLSKTSYSKAEIKADALKAVAALGDPMQAFSAGLAASAARSMPVYLAGGSQMLAVWALLRALDQSTQIERNLTVLTTKWVAFDSSAGISKLADILQAPLAAACPDFMSSRHAGLRAYEEGNVKEGVGAGASMCLANMAGFSPETIMAAIDRSYDEMVLKNSELRSL
ncbi:MAG: TIGR00303 family protein [Candidatus Obscuribacterales bacterium]|nr:TIGR00303 family protein [Candidatus Obscuribacterales bacterium]